MIKAAIFDLDGTLYDYDAAHIPAMKNLLSEGVRLLNISENEFSKAFEWGKQQVKRNIPTNAACHNRLLYIENALEYLGFKPAVFALELYEAYWSAFLDSMKLREGALELLDFLRNKGIRICLCSDLTAHIQYRKLRKLKIEDYFDFIVTSEEAGIEKPGEKIFKMALSKLGVKPEEAIYFGDDYEKDVVGAERVETRSIFIKNDLLKAKESIEYEKN